MRISKFFVFAITLLSLLSCGAGKGVVVMSYNVRYGKAKDGDNAWENRKSATPEMLKAVKPDVFGVQEALPFQEQFILETCPEYQCYGVGRDDGKDKGERMSVFYNADRFELKDHGTWWLSETPDVPSMGWGARHYRTATWMLLKDRKSGKEFYFVNTHLDHRSKEAQKNGLLLVVSKIREMNPNVPMVLTGDFNVSPDDPTLDALDGLMLDSRTVAKKTVSDPSFNGFKKEGGKVIDYIYFSGFSSAESFRVVNESYDGKAFISDHYPIVAELKY